MYCLFILFFESFKSPNIDSLIPSSWCNDSSCAIRDIHCFCLNSIEITTLSSCPTKLLIRWGWWKSKFQSLTAPSLPVDNICFFFWLIFILFTSSKWKLSIFLVRWRVLPFKVYSLIILSWQAANILVSEVVRSISQPYTLVCYVLSILVVATRLNVLASNTLISPV